MDDVVTPREHRSQSMVECFDRVVRLQTQICIMLFKPLAWNYLQDSYMVLYHICGIMLMEW